MLSQTVFPPEEAHEDEHEGPFPPQHMQSQVELPRVVVAVLHDIVRQLPPLVTLPGHVPAALTENTSVARNTKKKNERGMVGAIDGIQLVLILHKYNRMRKG